jgi:beta-N-acetylhexosaminidase
MGVTALAAIVLVSACGGTVARSRLAAPGGVAGAAPAISQTPSLHVLSRAYLAQMSLDDKLGQLFLAEFVGPDYTPDNAAFVEQLHAGGILLYNREMPTYAGTRALIAAAQAHSRIPLFVVVDEEGGWVDRLSDIYGFRPSASMIAATGSPAYARSEGARAAHDMTSLGLNFDLAPDVDVALVDGPDQSTRTFGSTPEAVTTLGGAYLDGLQSNHVIGCLKHFPGLGAATSDAHLGLPVIYRSRAEIEQVEMAPYRALFEHNAPGCVMSTDLLMPALDPQLPAELSPAIMTGVLRNELGFDGVAVTDALYMQGIAAQYSMPEAGVLAILAGNDFLMGPWWPSQMAAMIAALKAALASGRLTMARIDQSVRRILELKLRFGLLPQTLGTGPTDAQVPIAPQVALVPTTRRRGLAQARRA